MQMKLGSVHSDDALLDRSDIIFRPVQADLGSPFILNSKLLFDKVRNYKYSYPRTSLSSIVLC